MSSIVFFDSKFRKYVKLKVSFFHKNEISEFSADALDDLKNINNPHIHSIERNSWRTL